MAWNPQGGGGQGPWGQGPAGGAQPPDIEEMLRKGQDSFKRMIPGGAGGLRGIVLILVVLAGLWAASGFYQVEPDELGVEMVFGKMVATSPPGLNYNFPSPIGQVIKPKVTNINRVELGFRTVGQRGQRGAGVRNVTEESLMLTGDENIIDIQVVIFWKIDTRLRKTGDKQDNLAGVRNFLFNIRNPELTVKLASESAMREIIGKNKFEFARTQGRTQIAGEAQVLIQEILDRYKAGMEVTAVQVQKVDPPDTVINAFRDVQIARADMERKINEAEAYRNEIVQQSEGKAFKITNKAEAYKQEKVTLASGESQRFLAVLNQYRKEKDITRRRLYLETMKKIMGDIDKVIIDSSKGGAGVLPYLPLDGLTRESAAGAKTGGTGR